jgi:ribosomal protein L37AE/L43A
MKINLGKRIQVELNDKGAAKFSIRDEVCGFPHMSEAKATKKAMAALRTALLQHYYYLPMKCPNCERHRLEFDGKGDIICEKCGMNHSEAGAKP